MSPDSDPDVSSDRRRARAFALLMLGLFGTLALVYQFTLIYFTPGEVPDTTRGAEIRYLVTAGTTLAAFVGCMLLAGGGRSDVLVRCGGGGLSLALVVAALFSVPQGRWWPDPPERQELPSNYNPCLSGSTCDMAG